MKVESIAARSVSVYFFVNSKKTIWRIMIIKLLSCLLRKEPNKNQNLFGQSEILIYLCNRKRKPVQGKRIVLSSETRKKLIKVVIMRSIARILNSLAPIVNVLGIVAFIIVIVKGYFKIMIPMVVLFAVGLIFGKQAFKQNCLPRIFWAQSVNSLLNFPIGAAIGYGLIFALWVPFIRFFTLLF